MSSNGWRSSGSTGGRCGLSLAEIRRHLAFIDRKISFCEDTLDE